MKIDWINVLPIGSQKYYRESEYIPMLILIFQNDRSIIYIDWYDIDLNYDM